MAKKIEATKSEAINIVDVCRKVPTIIESIVNKKAEGITSVSKEGEEWKVVIEVLERKAIPDTQDILNIYELKLTSYLELTGYKRIGMRHRGDMVSEEE
jgi:hypothetical protein